MVWFASVFWAVRLFFTSVSFLSPPSNHEDVRSERREKGEKEENEEKKEMKRRKKREEREEKNNPHVGCNRTS